MSDFKWYMFIDIDSVYYLLSSDEKDGTKNFYNMIYN